jgi:hypothetical protein
MSTLRRSSSSYGSFADGIVIRGMPLLTLYPGNVYWVDENGGGGSRGTFAHPVATLAAGVALCTPSNGDIVVMKPGHVENISSDGALDMSKADVCVVGTGTGSNQAKIVFDTADTASIDITAANVTFVNVWFEAAFAMVDGAIDVEAAGDYFSVIGCRVTSTSASTEFEEFINLAAGADYFSFIGNDVSQIDTTTPECLVKTVGESIGMRVLDNIIIMEASVSIFDIADTAITGNPLFQGNTMVNLTAAADSTIVINASTVATFIDERHAHAGEVIPVADTAASFGVNCHGSELANVGSIIWPKTATAWP